MAEPQEQSSVANPVDLVKQIRSQYPEYAGVDDKTLLSKWLEKYPETRGGIPKDFREKTSQKTVGAQGAESIKGPMTLGGKIHRQAIRAREQLPGFGAMAGEFLGGPPGAAAGAATGEALRQGIRAYQGLETSARPEEKFSTGVLKDVATQGALGLAVSKVGGSEVARKTLNFPQTVLRGLYKESMGSAEAQGAREAAKRTGIRITPQELAGKGETSGILKFSRAGFSPLARNVAETAQAEARTKATQEIGTQLQSFSRALTRPNGALEAPHAAGIAAQEGLNIVKTAAAQEEQRLYGLADDLYPKKTTTTVPTSRPTKLFDASGRPLAAAGTAQQTKMTGGAAVGTKGIKQFASDLEAEIGRVGPSIRKLGGDSSVMNFIDVLKELPDHLNFREAATLRSQLIASIDKAGDVIPNSVALKKKLTGIVDEAMETGAKDLDPQAYSAWRTANAFTKARHALFDRTIVRDIMGEHPELIFDKLGTKNVTDAKDLMSAFNNYVQYTQGPERAALLRAKETFQQAYLARLINDDPTKLGALLKKAQPVLTELMDSPQSKEVVKNLTQLGNLLERQADIKGVSHWLLYETIGSAVSGAVGHLAGGPVGAGVGTTLSLGTTEIAPWVLAKILYSPTATKFLIDGVVDLPRTPAKANANILRAVRSVLGQTTGVGVDEEEKPAQGKR